MRNSIAIFGQNTTELLQGVDVVIKDAGSGATKASTSPAEGQLEIIDNQDGTYYLDVAETFRGTVYVGSEVTAQDEMTNFLIIGDDLLSHLAENGVHLTAAEKTKVGNLPDDAASEISNINTALGNKAATSALATLSAAVGGKASATPGTGMKAETDGKVAPSLDANFLEVVEGKIRIKQQFADEGILSNSKTLCENLMLVAAALQNVKDIGSGGSVGFLNLTARATHLTAVPLGQAQLYYYYSDPVAASGTYGLYVAYNVDGTVQRDTIKESTWGSGGE